MQQKRTYKRFYFNGKAALKTGNGRSHILPAYVDDIGLGGFRIRSQEKLELNKNVGVTLSMPLLDRPLLGKGRIRHIKPVRMHETDFFSMGIQFTQINKNKVIELIDKAFGWTKKPILSHQLRRELSFLLKVLPIIIAIAWLILEATKDYPIAEQPYTGATPQRVVIYY